MQVSKWGNSLAVRISASVAAKLELREGDEVELVALDYADNAVGVKRKLTREEAIAKLRALRGLRPADYKFDRDEANER